MKKYVISLIVLVLLLITFVGISFTNKNDLTELNEIIDLYYEIINPLKLDLKNNIYNISGTLNEEYHYIDAHGGQGFKYSEVIDYEIMPDISNNILYLKLNDIRTKLDNEYINYYFKLLNINKINIDNSDYKRHINYLEYNITNYFNDIFNANYSKVLLKKYKDKYIIIFDNNSITIKDSEITYSKNNNLVCNININDNKNNLKIKFDEKNTITIIKENNSNYRYNFLINNVPFYINKKDNNLSLKINYIARKYNDFTINTIYNINKIDSIDNNLFNEDKLNDLALYDYINKIKEVSSD